jgi:hypothetical protein
LRLVLIFLCSAAAALAPVPDVNDFEDLLNIDVAIPAPGESAASAPKPVRKPAQLLATVPEAAKIIDPAENSIDLLTSEVAPNTAEPALVEVREKVLPPSDEDVLLFSGTAESAPLAAPVPADAQNPEAALDALDLDDGTMLCKHYLFLIYGSHV